MDLYVNRAYGDLVVIRGKAPRVPETYHRDTIMDSNYYNDPKEGKIGETESNWQTADRCGHQWSNTPAQKGCIVNFGGMY